MIHERQTNMTRPWWFIRNYALGWVLLALFLASWAGQFWTGWEHFVGEAQQQQQTAHLWGQDGYIYEFWDATLENWQSEFLQLLTFMVLTSFLIFKGSPESKDSDEETQALIQNLSDKVDELMAQVKKKA